MFGGGDGIAAGCVDDDDAALGGSIDVDGVNTRARPADHPQARGAAQDIRGDARLTADQERISLGQYALEWPQERQAVFGDRVRDQDQAHQPAAAVVAARSLLSSTFSACSTASRSSSMTQPMCPIRKILPVRLPCPPARTTPWRSSSARSSAVPFTPSGR